MVSSTKSKSHPGRRPLVVGNWKMNGTRASSVALLAALRAEEPFGSEVSVCCPYPYLADVVLSLQGSGISWGAQDCSHLDPGAHTGDVAAVMLTEFGCRYVIVGHSERRVHHAESDQRVADKARMALAHGLTPIVCVGETLDERVAMLTESIVKRQLSAVVHTLGHCVSQIVVAYEPIWAIGSGLTATPEQAQAVHSVLRAQLAAASTLAGEMRLLYGGSVTAANAHALFAQPDIDGGLVGGASLKANEFSAICRAATGAALESPGKLKT
ncbi:MAG: triose-phosphate isomerase [Pseudomonadota bacterium]|nr:triose-phosphate isomerase [Pseudomonadota bacterium]